MPRCARLPSTSAASPASRTVGPAAARPASGSRDDSHLYAADLDLFGRGSLFELLSLARTQPGEETLAAWLKTAGRARRDRRPAGRGARADAPRSTCASRLASPARRCPRRRRPPTRWSPGRKPRRSWRNAAPRTVVGCSLPRCSLTDCPVGDRRQLHTAGRRRGLQAVVLGAATPPGRAGTARRRRARRAISTSSRRCCTSSKRACFDAPRLQALRHISTPAAPSRRWPSGGCIAWSRCTTGRTTWSSRRSRSR